MAYPLSAKLKTVIRLFTEPKVLSALISQRIDGLLYDEGWFESFKSFKPVDRTGNPVPWTTYSFIDFIRERLNKDLTIFEYGSGNSTLFFAPRVKSVISCEHDKKWIDELKNSIPSNCEVLYSEEGNYESAIVGQKSKFDFILVDAIRRNECIKTAVDHLTENGVIVLDDSERPEYKEGISFLAGKGFRKIDFFGVAPGILFKKCTTVFYRQNNVLGI